MPLSEGFIRRYGNLTEKYTFYKGEVELRYNVRDHIYMLVTPTGLVPQDGVTSVCHVIDKSEVLIPWAVKMMGIKLVADIPKMQLPTGEVIVNLKLEDFEIEVQKAKSAHKDKLEDAGAVGHQAHNWVEHFIKSVLKEDESRKLELLANMPQDDRAANGVIAALDWMKNHNVRWISTERKIYSRKFGYAGTLDGLCVVDSCDDPKCCPHAFKDRLSVADWKTSNYLYPEYRLQTAAYQQAHVEESGDQVQDRWIIRLGKEDAKFEAWHLEYEAFAGDFKAFEDALDLTRSVRAIKKDIADRKDVQRTENKRVKEAAKKVKEEELAAEKAAKKAEKQAQLLAAKRVQCSKANRYKGLKYPKCGPEGPCEACLRKYEERQCQSSSTALVKLLEDSRSSSEDLTDLVKRPSVVFAPVA